MSRPSYVSEDWMTYADGLTLREEPPARLRHDNAMSSPDLWERVVGVYLQARDGDFRHVPALLDVARHSADWELRNCALQLFGLTASRSSLDGLVEFFSHADYDTRLAAYKAAGLACTVPLARALASRYSSSSRDDQDAIRPSLYWLLAVWEEPSGEDYPMRWIKRCDALQERYGDLRVFAGEALETGSLVRLIVGFCSQDDAEESGGVIANVLDLLEAMTGVAYAGSINEDVAPVMPVLSRTLNKMQQAAKAMKLEPGVRYFYGHRVD